MTIETLSVGLVDIKTRKEPGELTGINMYHLLFGLRPAETVFFKSFIPEAESVSIPEQDFNNIPAAIAEGKETLCKKIICKIFCHKPAQPINGLAHICHTNANIDFAVFREQFHDYHPKVWKQPWSG
jgi:hypothetical protein